MPEGDTIARLAAKIADRFAGQVVTSSIFRHPRLATLDLTGRTLVGTESHGKHLFLNWDDDRSLHLHLLMQGRIRFGSDDQTEEWRRRFELRFPGGAMTGVDVPILRLIRTDRVADVTGHLGPDLCGSLDVDLAVARLAADVDSQLGAALLNQRNIAGFGNIYAVEVPYICGVSPLRKIGTIDGLESLVAVGAALIRVNAHLGPQNTTGRRLERSDHHILSGRTTICPRCGSALRRLSGDRTPWSRRTAWCPVCQHDSHGVVDISRAKTLLGLHPARRLLTFGDHDIAYSGDLDPVTLHRRGRGRDSYL